MCSSAVPDDVPAEHGGRGGSHTAPEEVRSLLTGERRKKSFWKQGEPFVWASGAALSATLALSVVLLLVVLRHASVVFWAHPICQVKLTGGGKLLGERVEHEKDPSNDTDRVKFHVGNREFGPSFRWVDVGDIQEITYPDDAFKLDRVTNLNYFGFLKRLDTPGLDAQAEGTLQDRLRAAMKAAQDERERSIEPLEAEEKKVSRQINNQVKYAKIDAEYRRKNLLREGLAPDSPAVAALDARLEELEAQETRLKDKSEGLTAKRTKLERSLRENVAVFEDVAGREKPIALVDIIRFTWPNSMGFFAKVGHYLAKTWELLSADPREANQDGGLFPAIFGTVLMVFLMAITCFPLGVLAGIYLGEYAKEGPLVRLVRVAVNNLAGIPSIVYGIFGLGFFIYICGGTLDRLLYPARVDASEPVFGRGCIIWASLTLGLLTIPVVIVSTEEALRQIPRGIREGSYALGATKFQTLCRVLVPMGSPGIMTGFILAMARAVGEVAPLMITGAVKSAPVPMDGSFPYVHLDRQFMHLGYHILDISCKSPNVEATKPMVYVTTLLLLLIVLTMTSLAVWLRNRMRKRYQIRAI